MKVFISHSTLDGDLLDEHIMPILSEYFKMEELIVLDENRTIGQHYVQIVNGIEACDFFIVIITINSIGSAIVLNEISLAFSQKKTIIPIQVNDAVSKQFSVLIGNITPAKYSTTNNNVNNIGKYIEDITLRSKLDSEKVVEEKNIIVKEQAKENIKATLKELLSGYRPSRNWKRIVSISSIISIAILIYLCLIPSKEIIRIYQFPKFDSIGGEVKTCLISGEIGSKYVQGNSILVYCWTNTWYVQPSEIQPLTPIDAAGKWQVQTHLGSKYCIYLVKNSYQPSATLLNLLPVGNDIIAFKIIP